MSITSFVLTDFCKTGIQLQYIRPHPIDQILHPSIKHTNPQVFSCSAVDSPPSSIHSSLVATGTAPIAKKSAVIQEPEEIFTCPLIWTEYQSKPDWLCEELVQDTLQVAQECGVMLNKTHLNLVPVTDKVREAAYSYYYRLNDVQNAIELHESDIDYPESLVASINEVMGECLYNIGISHLLAAFQSVGSVERDSIRHLTEAAGVFDFLMNEPFGEDSERLELSEDNLRVLSSLCMASAYEISLQYYYCDTYHQVDINAQLAHSACYFYTLAAAVTYSANTIPNREMVLNYCNVKRTMLEGMMLFIKSIEIDTTKGDSRRRRAVHAFKDAGDHIARLFPGERRQAELEIAWYIKRCTQFRKLSRKGLMQEGAFSTKKRRSDKYKDLIPMDEIKARYPRELTEYIAMLDARKIQSESGDVGETLLVDSPSQKNTETSLATVNGSPSEVDCSKSIDMDIFPDANTFSNINLSINTCTENEDIRLITPPITPGATHYHLITSMITLKAPSLKVPAVVKKKTIGTDEFAMSASQMSCLSLTKTNVSLRTLMTTTNNSNKDEEKDENIHDSCSNCALLFIVDVNYEDTNLAYLARCVVAFAARCGRLNKDDRIGLVIFDKFGEPSITVLTATEENVNSMTDIIINAKNIHLDGNSGPYLIKAILLAIDKLRVIETNEDISVENSRYNGTKEIVVVTDGFANGFPSDGDNWLLYSTKEVRDSIIDSKIPIHTFAAGDAADHELLRSLSEKTNGNHGTYVDFNEEEGLNKLRLWVVGIVSSAKQRVASNVNAYIKCSSGVLIASVVPDYYVPPPTTKYNTLNEEINVPFLPLAAESESHVLVTFAVPVTLSKMDIISLAAGHVKYFDSIRCVWKTAEIEFSNICSTRILSREIHYWLNALQAQDCKGPVHVITSTANRSLVRGSEIISPADRVDTGDNGFCTLSSLEGTRFEMKSNTNLKIEEVNVNDIKISSTGGVISIVTANQCKVRVTLDMYHVDIECSSCVSISYDRNGEFNINCVVGSSAITLTSGEKKTVTKLPSPRCTSAHVPGNVVIPWVVNEKAFLIWIVYENETSRRLKNTIRIQTHYWRTKCASCLREAASLICRSMRVGSLTHNFATTICRQIILFEKLSKAKFNMTNSIAYTISNKTLDMIRKAMDQVLKLSESQRRKERTWNDVYDIYELACAIGNERSWGGSKTYCTSDQLDKSKEQMSARARYETLMAEEKERQQAALRDATTLRRVEMIMNVFPNIDFGAAKCVEIRHLLTIVYDLPVFMDTFPSFCDILMTIGSKYSLSDSQFCSVFLHCGQHLKDAVFSLAIEEVQKKAEMIAKVIESDILSRCLFALFMLIDDQCKGYVTVPSVVDLINKSLGDNLQIFKRVEKLTNKVIDVRNHLLEVEKKSPILMEDPIREESQEKSMDLAVNAPSINAPYWDTASIETIHDAKATLYVFIESMVVFFEGQDQHVVHQELKQLVYQVHLRNKEPDTTEGVLDKQRQTEEREHLIQWDLRHIFDGIPQKNVMEITKLSWEDEYIANGGDPTLLQVVCAPVCKMAGIVAPVKKFSKSSPSPVKGKASQTDTITYQQSSDSMMSSVYTDYWGSVRKILKVDCNGFFKFLANFPPLSVTHRQALKIAELLKDPRLEGHYIYTISPVLSRLLDWLRLILRIAYLFNRYDISPPALDNLFSVAVAMQKDAMALINPNPVPEEFIRPKYPSAPQQSTHFARSYRNVFDKPPQDGYGTTTTFHTPPPKPPSGKPVFNIRPYTTPNGNVMQNMLTGKNPRQKILYENETDDIKKINKQVSTETTHGNIHSADDPKRGSIAFSVKCPGEKQRIFREKSLSITSASSSYLKNTDIQLIGKNQKSKEDSMVDSALGYDVLSVICDSN